MTVRIASCDAPGDAERQAIIAPLAAFNADNGYPGDPRPIAITLTDEGGTIVGGLWGRTIYDWLFVEFLVVSAALRGEDLGTRLLRRAEDVAIARGCVGAWLTTFGFQAHGFYEKMGYAVFGELDRSPRDNARIFLRRYFA